MITERMVRQLLEDPAGREWSIQGLGMLRTYLDDDYAERLHIWDPDSANEDVSTIHDHPWDFTSTIVSGHMSNQRYEPTEAQGDFIQPYQKQQLVCGVGGHLVGEPSRQLLRTLTPEHYYPGSHYGQMAPEFHESYPSYGAVTVIKRAFHADRDIATVMWQTGSWITAEPRDATPEEVKHFTELALRNWQV